MTQYLRYLADVAIHSFTYEDFSQELYSQVRQSSIGAHVRVGRHAVVLDSQIGSYSYIGEGSWVARADVGRFCSIAPGCRIGLGKHPADEFVSTHPAFYSVRNNYHFSFAKQQLFKEYDRVIIGNDVWIGANALIADGVRIGNGAIIGLGAVVVKSVPDYAIFGGVPARLIRYRFTQEEMAWLNRFRWWDKNEEWLYSHAEAFRNIQTLIHASGQEFHSEEESSKPALS
ncbi:MAG: CatB-related O-acetyltransferase [Terracidiphilus sp.]